MIVMTDETEIEQLVERAQAGDAEACGLLFDRFHLPVYRFVASRVVRPSDAEDITQTVFLKALEALPRYESRGIPFGGWLFRLSRNAVIDHVRTRREIEPLDDLIEVVAAALRSLTPDQRETITLRFFAGLSARDAALVMGRQEGTIRGLQFRAIGAIRRQLGLDLAQQAG